MGRGRSGTFGGRGGLLGYPRRVTHSPDQEADPLDEAWARVEERWDDREAHRKFVGLCSTLGRLPEAGRRYREVRDNHPDPERRAEAERHIDRLLGFAMQSLEVMRTEPPRRARGLLLFIAFVLTVGMIGIASWLVLRS